MSDGGFVFECRAVSAAHGTVCTDGHLEDLGGEVLTEVAGDATFVDPDAADGHRRREAREERCVN